MKKLYLFLILLFVIQTAFSIVYEGGSDEGGGGSGSGATSLSYNSFTVNCKCGNFCSKSAGSYDNAYVVDDNCGGCGGWPFGCNPPTGTATWHCDSGYKNCDLALDNGCEAKLSEDPKNCGSCGHVCSSGVCKDGVCLSDENSVAVDSCSWSESNANRLPDYDCGLFKSHMWECKSGYKDCDNDENNGCEAKLSEDPKNCGSCGHVCSSGVCKDGVCLSDENSVRTSKCVWQINGPSWTYELPDYKCTTGSHMWECRPDYKDCNPDESDGCEAYIIADPKHCGSCGNECPGGEWGVCDNKQCLDNTQYFSSEDASVCDDNNKWCSRYHLEMSNSHDNFGNMITSEYKTRSKTYYTYKCNSAYRNCDGNPTNGCETGILFNVNNCGSCGHSCYDNPCSGARALRYTSVRDIDSICKTQCSFGRCKSRTKIGGVCITNRDCDDNLYCYAGLPTAAYCSPANKCPYDKNGNHIIESNEFYEEGAEVEVDGEFFICKNEDKVMKWKSFDKVLDLGNLITFNHEHTTTTGAYMGNFGMAKSCNSDLYRSCSYEGPFYAYQFCTDVRVSFDGMFSLETGQYVPIYISEQELYNPYSSTTLVLEMDEK